MNNLSHVQKLTISKQILNQTYTHLRAYGVQGLEGFVLWNGVIDGDNHAVVKEAYIPQQESIETDAGLSVTIPGNALHRLNVHLHEAGLNLLAQVHSHPDEAYHSSVDDVFPVATQIGNFSLVIPYFGALPFSSKHCAMYRLRPTNRWEQLTPAQVEQLIIIKDRE